MSFNLFFSPRLFPSFFYYVIDALFLTLFLSSTICGPYSCKVWFLFRSGGFFGLYFLEKSSCWLFSLVFGICACGIYWVLMVFGRGFCWLFCWGFGDCLGKRYLLFYFVDLQFLIGTCMDINPLYLHICNYQKENFYRIMTTQYTSIDVWWHHRYLLKNDKVWEDSICLLSVLTT